MLDKIIKCAFGLTGALTGMTLVRFLFIQNGMTEYLTSVSGIGIIVFASLAFGIFLYVIGGKIIRITLATVERLERALQNLTLYELLIGAAGLIVGLIIANLISIPIVKIPVIGVLLSIMINIFFGICGVYFALLKRHDSIFPIPFRGDGTDRSRIKILDTSAIIDGRILDISRTGFLEGEIVVPGFVLEELRHLADSHDDIVRAKGRRGLDVLNTMKSDQKFPIRIGKENRDPNLEVDEQLLNRARELKAKIITNDFNLGKVARLKGIPVLNINDLANALKPLAVSGEEMTIRVVKEGKENGQGIGYLEDGTMVVVEGGNKFRNQLIDVVVTSVLQTSAGRMIFARFKTVHFPVAKIN
ncbi:PIN/TRAM domain-containing protein [Thermoclostridium caenicola]|uniref:Uncharacterized conserved protein YacL, contains PIN and TRAM domains n=1 Tax=Thermoclostridium caenicola TaxID=659425 RepID=A0A1M6FHH0_9FIRM|nr:PIN domain-containing protein [Thermoclostridium caenicola]SHI97125.1 Uncharacterized conserved protein YacL, contains PIN and TRAM domains [Thermoclostridium caenicola]